MYLRQGQETALALERVGAARARRRRPYQRYARRPLMPTAAASCAVRDISPAASWPCLFEARAGPSAWVEFRPPPVEGPRHMVRDANAGIQLTRRWTPPPSQLLANPPAARQWLRPRRSGSRSTPGRRSVGDATNGPTPATSRRAASGRDRPAARPVKSGADARDFRPLQALALTRRLWASPSTTETVRRRSPAEAGRAEPRPRLAGPPHIRRAEGWSG